MKILKTVQVATVASVLLASGLSALGTKASQQELIKSVKAHHHKQQANVSGKQVITKRVAPKQADARVMVKLKRGVSAKQAYMSLFQGKAKIARKDVELVKSFPIVDTKVKAFNNQHQSQAKTLVVLKSKTLSDKELLQVAKKMNGVEIAEISKPVSINSLAIPNDEFMPDLWGMHNDGANGLEDADIDAPEAWSQHVGNKNVVVGVIDTGIDFYHPDLKNNIWQNEKELQGQPGVDDDNNGYIDDIWGINPVYENTFPMDDAGHGTHVAGTIAAEGNNTIGVAGVNWNTRVAACKFLDMDGWGYLDGAVECVNYFNSLKSSGVNVVATNNSWGGGGYSDILNDAISTANDMGILFVAAAGNDANDNDSNPSYPASYNLPNVISVAATNSNDELAYFSNYGATTVHLAAPGEDIKSTLPSTYVCRQNGNNVIVNDTFDNLNNWSMLTTNTDMPVQDIPSKHWKLDSSMAYVGNNSLSDSLNSNEYLGVIQSALYTQDINLSNVGSDTVLCASVHIKGAVNGDYEAYGDFGIVVSNDGGEHWMWLDWTADNYEDWTEFTVTIPSDMRSEHFKIALIKSNRYWGDDSTGNATGYNIDNFTVGSGDMVQIPHYGFYSGTSMATPHVTGAAALFASLDENITMPLLKQIILDSVDPLGSLDGLVSTGGRLNINNMLALYTPPSNLIDFDDIDTAGVSEVAVENYKGLTFGNFYAGNVEELKAMYGETGYNNGVVSGKNIIFNGSGHDANITDTKPFNFKSAYLTGAWNSDLNVTVKGYKDDTLKYSKTVTVSYFHPTYVEFNFDDVDLVTFHTVGGNQVYSESLKTKKAEVGNKKIGTLEVSGEQVVIDNMIVEQPENNESVKNDFNGDGFSDILVQNTSNGRVSAWLGSSTATVTAQYLKTLGTDVAIVDIADVNGDGFDDIIIKNGANGRVGAWLGSSAATVTAQYLKTLPSGVEFAGTGDVNGDGFDDIIVQNTSNGRVSAWLGSSAGTVTAQYLKTLGTDVAIVDIADVNGDGFDDIIIKNGANGRVSAWLGSSAATVTAQYLKTLPSGVEFVDTTDVNGDGFDDIIVQNTSNGRVSAWLGSSAGTVTAQYLKTLGTSVAIVVP
jgi:subtilisin family serine protease